MIAAITNAILLTSPSRYLYRDIQKPNQETILFPDSDHLLLIAHVAEKIVFHG